MFRKVTTTLRIDKTLLLLLVIFFHIIICFLKQYRFVG